MVLKENEFNSTEKPVLLHVKWNDENRIVIIKVILVKRI